MGRKKVSENRRVREDGAVGEAGREVAIPEPGAAHRTHVGRQAI